MTDDTYESLSDKLLAMVMIIDDEPRKVRLREIAARVRGLGRRSRQDDAEHMLQTLLAVIHRDGGHHTIRVGMAQSCEDAARKVLKLHHWADETDAPNGEPNDH